MHRVAGLTSLILALLFISDDSANARTYRSYDGYSYRISCNSNGFSLTRNSDGERFFFGRSGDTYSRSHGVGRWCNSNGGFGGNFGQRHIGFPRQEPFCQGAFVDYGPLC